jgi:hypothetical protein
MSTAEAVLSEVLEAFDFGNPVVGAMRFGYGHINDTFCVHTQPKDDPCACFILQRMSSAAFKRPDQLMKNIIGVTEYLGKQIIANGGDRAREAMDLGLTPDAVLTDVEQALDALGELTGRSAKEAIVSRIFERFCVGK